MLRSFTRDGERYERITIGLAGGRSACQARAMVADVLHRAHGFRTARSLTDRLAVSGGRFRVAIASAKVKALRRRLRLLTGAGLITLHVAGRPVDAFD